MQLKLKPKHLQGVPRPRRKGDPKLPHDHNYGQTGAHSKYRPEYCDAIRRYFAGAESWDLHFNDKGAGQCLPKHKLPTFERFAASIGVATYTLNLWCQSHPEFKEAHADAKALQRAFIMEAGGVSINGGFATFLLKCCHDMKEPESKQEVAIGEALAKLIGNMPS